MVAAFFPSSFFRTVCRRMARRTLLLNVLLVEVQSSVLRGFIDNWYHNRRGYADSWLPAWPTARAGGRCMHAGQRPAICGRVTGGCEQEDRLGGRGADDFADNCRCVNLYQRGFMAISRKK